MPPLSSEFRESLDIAARAYSEALFIPGSPAQNYLRGRGITLQTADAYRLGEVDGTIPEHASYRGWICIPYLTRLGGVVSLKFRRLEGDGPKYITPYPTRMFNTIALDRAERLGYVAITEGEFDAIVLDDMCGIPAVGIPGVETWKAHPEWREILTGFSKVLVFMDQDEDRVVNGEKRNPGREFAEKVIHDLDTAHIVSLPAKDVNEAFLQFGSEKIREVAGV